MIPRFAKSTLPLTSFIKVNETTSAAVIQLNRPKALNAIKIGMFT